MSKKPSYRTYENYIRRKTKTNKFYDNPQEKGIETLVVGNNIDPSHGLMNTARTNARNTAMASGRVGRGGERFTRRKANSRTHGNLVRPFKRKQRTKQAR